MRRGEALKKYLAHNAKAAKVVGMLSKWDERATLTRNSFNIFGMFTQNAYQLAKRYRLKYAVAKKVASDRQRFWE